MEIAYYHDEQDETWFSFLIYKNITLDPLSTVNYGSNVV